MTAIGFITDETGGWSICLFSAHCSHSIIRRIVFLRGFADDDVTPIAASRRRHLCKYLKIAPPAMPVCESRRLALLFVGLQLAETYRKNRSKGFRQASQKS